jgi:hypothetical protein
VSHCVLMALSIMAIIVGFIRWVDTCKSHQQQVVLSCTTFSIFASWVEVDFVIRHVQCFEASFCFVWFMHVVRYDNIMQKVIFHHFLHILLKHWYYSIFTASMIIFAIHESISLCVRCLRYWKYIFWPN